jgi:signal transduction histidine kinase
MAGKQYQQVIHTQKPDGTADYSMFDTAFAGKSVHILDQTELVNQRGKVPIVGTVAPLELDVPGSIVFIFSDDTVAMERKKEDQAFFSAAAHELRTPLTVIRLTVSLLQSKFDTLGREKIMEYLRRTSETSESLVRLVNDFLNVSRIDQGRLQVSHEPFDVVTLTDEVIKELDLLVHERNLYIHHEPAATETRQVVGDRNKAKEVLINLISNSIKYTVQGGLTITHEANESMHAIKVTDTGGGIPLESQGLLFKRFLQIGSAKGLASTKSSGFGLYLSKKFALLMHGDIALEKSEPGKGSTFVFTLPLR